MGRTPSTTHPGIFHRALYLYHSPDKLVREKAITSTGVLGFRKTIEDGTMKKRDYRSSLLEQGKSLFCVVIACGYPESAADTTKTTVLAKVFGAAFFKKVRYCQLYSQRCSEQGYSVLRSASSWLYAVRSTCTGTTAT